MAARPGRDLTRKGPVMRKDKWIVLGMSLALAVAGRARADVWDVQTSNDNTPAGTKNELLHGSDQIHDLGALPGPLPDEDWYRIGQKAYSSYEVVVDATSGDIGAGVLLQRYANGGTTLVQTAVPVTAALNYSQSLRWMNTTGASVDDQFVRVISSGCNTNCGPDDVYRLRAFETTASIPRFNNSASQVTVLLLQNPSGYTITGNVYFWSSAGALLFTHPFSLPTKNTLVLNTAGLVPGVGGAITLASDGRYGDLTGKTVALEPSTGFSFDSPMVPRVN
jgi:hypothetical protein